MKEIPLTKGKVALVDDEDYLALCNFNWHAYRSHGLWYASTNIGHGRGNCSTISMHRMITNAPKGMTVDHVNDDGLDNQRQNLRICTNQQNVANQRAQQNRKSRFRGVTNNAYHLNLAKPWRAVIKNHGRRMHIGYFATEEEAAEAYDREALRLFGEFARFNLREGGS